MKYNEILIISGTPIISGAEFVLSDYLNKTKNIDKIILLHSNYEHVNNFYNKFANKKTYSSKFLNPTGASGGVFNKLRKIHNLFCSAYLIYRILLNKKINIVLGNNTGDIMFSFFSAIMNRKHINYIHDTIDESPIHQKMVKFFDKFVYKYITVSDSVSNSLINIGISKNKIVRVYNGLEYNTLNNHKQNKNLVFGFVGNITDRKNPLEYIYILNLLKNHLNNKNSIRGRIVFGDILDYSLYDEILINIKKLKLDIEVIGSIEREYMNKFYSSLDFLIVCSKQDPLPTVILEAFNNFTPVIGKHIGGIPEMILDDYNGYLYSSVHDLKHKIDSILSRKNELSENANQTILNKFNIEKKVLKLDNLLFSSLE